MEKGRVLHQYEVSEPTAEFVYFTLYTRTLFRLPFVS